VYASQHLAHNFGGVLEFESGMPSGILSSVWKKEKRKKKKKKKGEVCPRQEWSPFEH
jgi:hypothetical protein